MNKLLKQLPKQLTTLRNLVEKSLDQINQVRNDKNRFDTNANKYFMIYKYAIELKQPKIIECCLYDLERLLSLHFLDGYSYDYVETDQQNPKLKKRNRMLIDSIAEVIISCKSYQEENIHYLIVKCIQALMQQAKSQITRETFQLSYRTLFHFYKCGLNSTKTVIISLTQLLFEGAESYVKLTPSISAQFEQRGASWNHQYNFPEQLSVLCDQNNTLGSSIQEYVVLTLQNMLDDCVLYFERLKSGNNNVPISSVPQTYEAEDPKYKNYIEVKINNEIGVESGKFGWCIICRQGAPFFCKDTRVPVCSVPCKKKHFELSENIKILSQPDNKKQNSLQDCIETMNYLCVKSKDEKNKKCGLSLELIQQVISKYHLVINDIYNEIFNDQFINMIMNGMKNKKNTTITLQILWDMILHYRDILVQQIEIVVEYIFSKCLNESQMVILNFVKDLCQYPTLLIELFCNYDCTINRKNIIQLIFENIAKIGQGIHSSSECCILANQIIHKTIEQFKELTIQHQQSNVASQNPEQFEESAQRQFQKIVKDIENFDQHEKQLTYKQQLQKAIQRFQVSSKDALNYLIQLGLLEENNVKQYTQFFINNQVNKDQLGQYFGNANELNQQILSEFTYQIDFKSLNIIDGLRKYLTYFTLPGEAQQVDRIMLAFSQKYFEDNTQIVFNSGDEVYVFSYLLMILQTDMHNKSVHNKMTFQQFSKSAKLSMERELDTEYLKYIYESIQIQPLAIHPSLQQQDNGYYNSLVQNQTQLISISKSIDSLNYIFNPQIDYIKLFMEVIWPSLFVNLNILIEKNEDPSVITIALNNAEIIIQLMTLNGLQESCEQFIKLLCSLSSISESKPLKFKNQHCLTCIMDLAIKNGNSLKNNWFQVLETISQLDYIFGEKQRGKIFPEPLESTSKVLATLTDQASIDKVMQNTKYMDSRTILDFLSALIQVSLNEITLPEPRIFSLQRLVEVTSFNMDRIRLIWTQIWNLLRSHFVTVCIHPKLDIALYACDQLKQLSVKFLQRHEHNKFNFQKDFLQPFDLIYAQSKHYEVKEFILSCMKMLSHLCFYKLKSGWKIVFNIINQSLPTDNIQLINISIDIIEKVVSEDMIHVIDVFEDIELSFQHLFQREEIPIILKGIELVYIAVDNLIKQKNSEQFYAFWIQSLANICNLFRSTEKEIQSNAIKAFFKVLNSNSKSIQGHQYIQIMRGMMKDLFQSLETANKEICLAAHQSLLELIFEHEIREVLNDVLSILVANTKKLNEHLAKTSVLSFKQIIQKLGKQLNWDKTIQSIEQMVENTMPNILFDAGKLDESLLNDLTNLPELDLIINSEEQVLLCLLQLMLLDIIDDIQVQYVDLLNQEQFNRITQITSLLYQQSNVFNRQFKVRLFLRTKGLMPHLSSLPGLLKQEKAAFNCHINLLWQYYQKNQGNTQMMEVILKLIYQILDDTTKLSLKTYSNIFQIEQEKLIINNLSIIQTSIMTILNSIDLDSIQNQVKTLLQYFITLPSCYSLLIGQCPHCQKCPFQCQQKQEWKKLNQMIQSFQLKLINYL